MLWGRHGTLSCGLLLILLPKNVVVIVNAQLNENIDGGDIIVELARILIIWGARESGAKDEGKVGRAHLVLFCILCNSVCGRKTGNPARPSQPDCLHCRPSQTDRLHCRPSQPDCLHCRPSASTHWYRKLKMNRMTTTIAGCKVFTVSLMASIRLRRSSFPGVHVCRSHGIGVFQT